MIWGLGGGGGDVDAVTRRISHAVRRDRSGSAHVIEAAFCLIVSLTTSAVPFSNKPGVLHTFLHSTTVGMMAINYYYYSFARKRPFWMVECIVKGYRERCRVTLDGDMSGRTAIARARFILLMGLSKGWLGWFETPNIEIASVEKMDGVDLDETDHRHFYVFALNEPLWMVKCTAKGYTDEFILTFDIGLFKRTAAKRAVRILRKGFSSRADFRVVSTKMMRSEDVMAYLAELKYASRTPSVAAHQVKRQKTRLDHSQGKGNTTMNQITVPDGAYFERPKDTRKELLDLIRKREGLTERELAKAIFGPDGYQQQVNQVCRSLCSQGLVERRGAGGTRDPYRYYLKHHSSL